MVRIISATFFITMMFCFSVFGETRVETYFDNTDHKLTVYEITGKEPGATMMIIGGIQGDEPGGYIAADLYADMLLEKGKLIVVPRANFFSIKKNNRGVNGDMNRKFSPGQSPSTDYDSRIVDVLKKLMAKSDVLLNLHEGSGFYYPEHISNIRNPMRYGQSIIIDTAHYTGASGDTIDLMGPASRVIEEINRNIKNNDHTFHLNNHDTFSEESRHKEQRGSATYNALTLFGIPGYGIETSKSIRSIETKVRYETLAINAFMREYGIVPEHPSIYLPIPKLNHLVIKASGNPNPYAVQNGSRLSIPSGTEIMVTSVIANYNRGLSVDIAGHGNSSDLNRNLVITQPTVITVFKDAYKCGEISIDINDNTETASAPHIHNNVLEYVEIRVDSKNMVVSSGDTLHIVKGDIVRLVDAVTSNRTDRNLRLNFRGFVGNKTYNDAEDRGYDIDTSADLIGRFSLSGDGRIYQAEAIKGNEVIGRIFISVEEPVIQYIIVEDRFGKKLALTPGDIFNCDKSSSISILSVVSNVGNRPDINVMYTNQDGRIRALELPAKLDISAGGTVSFTRSSINLGEIALNVDERS